MGTLKEEVFQLLQNFITDNKGLEKKHFISALRNLIESLTVILNKNSEVVISEGTVTIHTDGSSQGNPGKAGIGFLIKDHLGRALVKEKKDIGIRTNNQAEYTAVIEALKRALEKGCKKAVLYSDSELVINQVNNIYRIKNADLRGLYDTVKKLEKEFKEIRFIHVKRGKNREADILSR